MDPHGKILLCHSRQVRMIRAGWYRTISYLLSRLKATYSCQPLIFWLNQAIFLFYHFPRRVSNINVYVPVIKICSQYLALIDAIFKA